MPVGQGRHTEHPAEGAVLPSGTVTFLLTDIEGSTQRWQAHPTAMADAVQRHYDILDTAVTRHGGVRPEEQGEGDSIVAVFLRASDAIAAAADAQLAFEAEEWEPGGEMAVRMAVHTGEAQLRGSHNYAGPSVIRCARLRGLAHGGQVLVSSATAMLATDLLPEAVTLIDLGEHSLRDLDRRERVFQVCRPGLRTTFPPLRTLAALPSNLPLQLSSFVGRSAELVELEGLIGHQRLVTLVGAGGCGKTRLAAEACARVAPRYPDGVWWVDLASVSDAERVPTAVMEAVELRDVRGLDPVERLTAYLGPRRLLLVLDNCEHLLDETARFVDALARACPNVDAVATSREPLGIPGEVVWRVPALVFPAEGRALRREDVDGYDAVRLFLDRAGAARSGFPDDDDTVSVISAICARLDGLPLAIELAAARVQTLTPSHILSGLSDRFRLLSGGARTVASRHRTLHASVQWSHDLLSNAERVLFRRLSAFSGGFTVDAAGEVGATGTVAKADVTELISRLVEKSLVVFDPELGRYHLMQTIQEFAHDQLFVAGEVDEVRARHAGHFTELAETTAAALDAGILGEHLDALEADHDNMRAALEWSLATRDHSTALRLASSLTVFWAVRGHYSEAQDWHRRVLAAAPVERSALRARATWGLAYLSLMGMDVINGYGAAEGEAVATAARDLGDRALLGRALVVQGLLQLFVFPSSAQRVLEEAVEAARRSDDAWALAFALSGLATFWVLDCDRPDLAEPALGELWAIAESTGSPYWRAWHGVSVGIGALRQGRLPRAQEVLEAALSAALELRDPQLETFAVAGLAEVHIGAGAFERATTLLTESVERQSGSARGRQELLECRLAAVALAVADLNQAHRQLDAVESSVREISMPMFVGQYDALRGRLALEEGDPDEAARLLEEAAAIAATVESPWGRAEADIGRARLAQATGDLEAAENLYHHALAVGVERQFPAVIADTLEALASLAFAGESYVEATRLAGAAHALRDRTGLRRWPLQEMSHTAVVAAARAELGEAHFQQVWNEGLALSWEDAAGYARRGRGQRRRPSSGWASLTPTEVEVVALAGQGLLNAEIARQLFMAPGTVKVHLSHVYAKLGVANRAELAAQAAARPAPARMATP
jgi:predicted ATPase/class 3 adenylate cyclase/DNA-binding CsgD family transcriptional regulator